MFPIFTRWSPCLFNIADGVFQDLVKDKLRSKFKNARFKYPKSNADLDAERKTKKIRISSAAANAGRPKYGPPEYDQVPAARKAGYILAADNGLSAAEQGRLKEESFADRRWMLVGQKRSISDVLSRYGWMRDINEVCVLPLVFVLH